MQEIGHTVQYSWASDTELWRGSAIIDVLAFSGPVNLVDSYGNTLTGMRVGY